MNTCNDCGRMRKNKEGFYECDFREGVLRCYPACEHFLPKQPVTSKCDIYGKSCSTCSGCDTEAELAKEHEQQQNENWE